MQTKQTTRRRFLVAAITFSGLASVPSSLSWIGSSAAWADTNGENAKEPGAMAQLARLLFPHAELRVDVYAQVIDEVLAWTAADPATDGLLAAAEQALDAEAEQSWFDLAQDEQLAMLRTLQDDPAIVGGMAVSTLFTLLLLPSLLQLRPRVREAHVSSGAMAPD